MDQLTKDLIHNNNNASLLGDFTDLIPNMVLSLLPYVFSIALSFFAIKVFRKIINV